MEAQRFPGIHDLRENLPTASREPTRAQRKYFWIEEDPELTPRVARKETPLSAWS